MANRKLQGEIDKILKKVSEGVVEFDGILKKVYAATSSNQKEKYEGDLKKEIKKLQRYRDQIKVWITSNEVKQKGPLVDCRKLIETKMEQFKACEKETKTKAYSKEGLGLQRQDNDGKNEARSWIVKGIESLKTQIEQFESELENIPARKKKQESTRVEQLNTHIERHKFHLNALEQILRALNNERVALAKVMEIKDSVEYYIESNQDPYFQEEEDVYDSLGVKITPVGEEKGDDDDDDGSEYDNVVIDDEDDISEDGSEKEEEDEKESEGSSPATPPPASVVAPTTNQAANKNAKKVEEKKEEKSHGKDAQKPTAPAHVPIVPITSPTHTQPILPQPQTLPLPLPLPTPTKDDKMQRPGPRRPDAPVAKQGPPPGISLPQNQLSPQRNPRMPVHTPERKPEEARGRGQPHPQTHPQHIQSTPPHSQPHAQHQPPQQPQSTLPLAPPILSQPPPASLAAKHSFLQQQFNQLNISKDDVDTKDKQLRQSIHSSQDGLQVSSPPPISDLSSPSALRSSEHSDVSEPLVVRRGTSESRLAVGSNGDSALQAGGPTPNLAGPTNGSVNDPHSMLAASFANIPESIDTERPSTYLPKNPSAMTPQQQYYPALPLPVFEVPSIFEKFDTDTLFFIFYYQQGTYQQYLAARELKKQSWRYHKKYLTWFQRHEEPKEITNDYEQGTYVYFDYETGWCQRKKTEFTFEYRYLEE